MKQIRMRGAAALLSLALTLPLMLPGWTARAAALEESGVAISEETFPDAAFRSWLTDRNNLNGFGSDGYFSAAELAEIKSIDVSGKGIQTLEGIEQFSALEQLSCENNRLKELDVKQNRALRHLQCRFNQIAALDVSGLDNLISLNCESNHMKSLNLTGCTALEIIYCRSNDLPEVDFSTNTSLKFIETFDNRLSSIDLSKLTALEFVHLDHNLLTHIDLSANTNLSPIGSGFVARNNQLDTLTLPVKADLVVDPDVYAEQDPKVGYERVEWYEDAEYHIPVTGPITANGQTLYAKWLPNDYTIRFNSNGGSGSMPEQSGVWDQKLTLEKNTFRRTGYAFQGWKNVFGDDAFYDDESEVLNLAGKYQGQRVTLYAQWEPIQYTVAFDANGGQGEMAEESYRYDQSKNLPECTMTGPDDKIFAGWATEKGGSVRYLDQSAVRNLASEQGEKITLYAVWREKRNNAYLDDLDAAFAHYSAEDYTVQDWNALTGYYGTAWKELSTAEEEELEGIFTRATENMEAVETREMRVNAIVAAWRSEHRDALDAMNNHAVDEATAERLYGLAQEALKGIDAAFVVEHSDLAETADQEQVAALANEAVDKTLRSLSQLADAAAWVGTLNGLSERPLSEVTSEWYGSYADACTGADTYLLHLSRTMMQALEERRDLAQQKQQALTQLHMAYQSYDLTRYTAENQAKLEKILNAGRLAIEAGNSAADVESAQKQAQQDMAAVPTIDGGSQPGGGTEGGESGGSTGGNTGGGTGGAGGGGGAGGVTPEPPVESVPPTQTTVTDPVSGATALVSTDANGAVSAQITLPAEADTAVLTLPAKMKASTVAVMHKSDGTTAVLPWAVAVEEGMRVRVSQSCQITLEERSVTYSDVAAQAWYQDGVQFVSARGLFSGIGAGRFAPEGAMTRSMVASVLYRMEGAPECTEGPTFTDVPEGSWFAPGVQWAAQMGITSGTGGGRFAPEEPVTREALAAMLYRYAQQHGAGAMGTGSGTENFADRESISSWAGEAMEWAASNGILLGNGGEIRPGDLASRAEVAAMLMRFSAVIVDAQR